MIKTPINSVLVVGGTHGNETTGIYLVNKLNNNKHLFKFDSLEIDTLIANKKACEIKQRYVEKDLNRCFSINELTSENKTSLEEKLAADIYKKIHCDTNPPDCIFDLHTTVTNTGIIIFPTVLDSYTITYLKELVARFPDKINIVIPLEDTQDDQIYLASLAKYGFGLEIGPIPMNALLAPVFKQMEDLLTCSLEIFEEINNGKIMQSRAKLECYKMIGSIDFIRNRNNEITTMVHPDLLDANFKLLRKGMPLFFDFYGNEMLYEGEDIYPIFINEPAYYEKGIAMVTCTKLDAI